VSGARRIVVLLALALAIGAEPAAAQQLTTSPTEAEQLGRDAYRYGLPLVSYLQLRNGGADGTEATNVLLNIPVLPTALSRNLTAPNVDTLYTLANLDLGSGPVVLGHGDMSGRYFVFQLLDPWTNTFGYVGTRTTGSAAGSTVISWAGAPGPALPGAQVIQSPTRRVWLIGRTFTTGGADLQAARAAMSTYTLRTLPATAAAALPAAADPADTARLAAARARRAARRAHAAAVRRERGRARRRRAPRRARARASAAIDVPTGLAFLDRLGHAMALNPPPAADLPMLARLARAGIGPDRRPATAGLAPGVLDALRRGVDAEAAELPGRTRAEVMQAALSSGGWYVPPPDIGNYGTDYDLRARATIIGLGANTPDEALYRTAYGDASGLPLDGSHSYRIAFPSDPPARAFWSLTLYDVGGFLSAGSRGRPAVGSAHPPLVRRADGSVVVVVSGTAPAEPDVNWLPAPAGAFRLDLRVYWPEAGALAPPWQPPPVQRTG
jgi:hypothetical protein